MIEANYAEIRDLINISTFRTVLGTELPDDANLMITNCTLFIKSNEDKEERHNAVYVTDGHFDIMTDYLSMEPKRSYVN